ncbi:MAG: hypothetical protein AVDCRST_MAG19-3192 [uncultured Thermomicrobiales bacterium]|uniref:Uncharacterized protein n=1 Tax=uncultured Thermomicrobiales bacterium TaxID=1645740 RepID=A0A6J4VF98_9BACT|nr:MAG: hypothetical protein AVDCRST_MAG19-3192 [uncultured Thermomicrobiales bacterium]
MDEPTTGAIKVAGVVRDVASFGGTSRVVASASDRTLLVSVPNDGRRGGAWAGLGQRVWEIGSPDARLMRADTAHGS